MTAAHLQLHKPKKEIFKCIDHSSLLLVNFDTRNVKARHVKRTNYHAADVGKTLPYTRNIIKRKLKEYVFVLQYLV